MDAEALRRRHEERVGQPRPVLGGGAQELGGAGKIAVGRRDDPDGPARDRVDQGEAWPAGPSSRWRTWSASARVSAPTQQRLVDALEPGARGGVVEVGGVGRGEDRRGVEEDRHQSLPALPARRRARRPRAATIERASSERRPWALRPTPTNASVRRRSSRGEVGLQGGRDHRRLRRPRAPGVAVQPVEQVRVGEDRRPLERHMRSYIPRWTRGAAPYPRPYRAPPGPLAAPARRPPVNRFEPNLRIPGPTPLPPTVREAGGRQMINHRGPEFAALLGRIVDRMQPFFGTDDEIVLLTAPARGGLEAAVVNVLSPGDRVARRHDRRVRRPLREDRRGLRGRRPAARGRVGPGRRAGRAARARSPRSRTYRAVLLTHNETSTGVTNPIAELAAAVREVAPGRPASSSTAYQRLGAVPFEMDAWGLRPRRDRLAEGLDGRARDGLRRRRRSGPGRRWRRRGCRASTSTSGGTARARPPARRRGRPPWRSCTRSTRASG